MMRRALLSSMLGVFGGLPPRRVDQETPSSGAGVAPGTASGTFRGRQVIVSGTGPGSGIFEYSGPAGVGNLVLSDTQASVDPFGNKTIPGGTAVYNNALGVALLYSSNFIEGFTGSLAGGWSAGFAGLSTNGSAWSVSGPLGIISQLVPAADTVNARLFASLVTGAQRFRSETTHGDGDIYDTGMAHLSNAAAVTLVNTSMTSIFANKPVVAATYRVTADLIISVGATGIALLFQLAGPAVGSLTSVKWRASLEAGAGQSVFAGHSLGSLASVTLPGSTNFGAGAVVHVWLSALVAFTATGNLNLQAQLSAPSATTQATIGCTMDVSPVG